MTDLPPSRCTTETALVSSGALGVDQGHSFAVEGLMAPSSASTRFAMQAGCPRLAQVRSGLPSC